MNFRGFGVRSPQIGWRLSRATSPKSAKFTDYGLLEFGSLKLLQTCYHCRNVVRYTDYNLDFRPWYPDGFVYCPRCKGTLRHNEMYAIN